MAHNQEHNLAQIEDLNQRGGRLLTAVDLIEAGTISLDLAAYLLAAVSGGASFMTAAMPGNAGKTTVLATLLTFLPPDLPIVTVADGWDLARQQDGKRACYLVHEIGPASFYSYLWGRDVQRFLALRDGCGVVASCMHADTIEQMRSVLVEELRISESDFGRLDLLLFLRLDRVRSGLRRRVASVYEAAGGDGHRLVWAWEEQGDRHAQVAPSSLAQCGKERVEAAREFLRSVCLDDVRDIREFRRRVVEFLTTDPRMSAD